MPVAMGKLDTSLFHDRKQHVHRVEKPSGSGRSQQRQGSPTKGKFGGTEFGYRLSH